MKKLVVLNDFPIIPPNHGGKIRIYNIYKHLSRRYDITYICFSNEGKIKETRITETFKEVQVPKSAIQKRIEIAARQFLGVSVDDIIAMFLCGINANMRSEVRKCLKDCDLIILAQPYLYPAVKNDISNRILLYESQNVEYILKKTIFGKGFLKRVLLGNVRKNEEEVIDRSKVVFATSSIDKDAFKQVYGLDGIKLYISPNGTDTSSFDPLYRNGVPIREKIISKPMAIFIGSGHPPNVDAAKAIIKAIAPAMHDVYFLICGSVCWGVRNESLPKNVGLTFEVTEEEKLELYKCSSVALNPMQSGSGTNIKMLEYMAAGLPVITTSIGARGLHLNSTNSVICEVSEFPRKIRAVLDDEMLYNALSSNGRKLVEEEYDWKKIAESMADKIDEISLN